MTNQYSLCFQCSQNGKTCCQDREIYVTPGDVRRIAGKTGVRNFFEFCSCNDQNYMEQDDDPVWMNYVFKPDHRRRIIKRQANGDCVFLSPQGCILTLDVRPLVCRLYPFNYNFRQIYPELEKGCPTLFLGTGQTLLQALGMSLDNARVWHRTLYSEILSEKQSNEDRIDLRPAF